MTDFTEILYPHVGYYLAGGYWRCACLHTYEAAATKDTDPDNEQPDMIASRHAQHLSEVLIQAGAELPAPDPRQALRERAARRAPAGGSGISRRPDPEILRDGSIVVPVPRERRGRR